MAMRERHGHLREAHLDCGWGGRSCYLWLAGTRGVPGSGALWTVSDRSLAQVLSVCSAEIPKSTGGSSRPNKVLVFSDVVERVAVGASPSSSESNRIELKSSALVK
jgi:hypothetical protein